MERRVSWKGWPHCHYPVLNGTTPANTAILRSTKLPCRVSGKTKTGKTITATQPEIRRHRALEPHIPGQAGKPNPRGRHPHAKQRATQRAHDRAAPRVCTRFKVPARGSMRWPLWVQAKCTASSPEAFLRLPF